jgi:hypothetical protein
MHTSSIVPLRRKFLGRTSRLVCCSSYSFTSSCPYSSDLKWWPHTGYFRGQNRWKLQVPNLVYIADGVTPPILNSEFVSWYSMLYKVRHAKRQQTMTIYSHCWCKLILKHIILPFAVYCLSLLQVVVILQILYIVFWFSFEWPVYIQ